MRTGARRPVARRLRTLLLAGAITAGGAAVVGSTIGAPAPSTGDGGPLEADPAAFAAPPYTAAQSRRVLGADGRFTLLLLGSDARPSHSGLRTDTIMVASVDPVTGKAAAFSIPRDTVNFPLSSRTVFPQKINALYSVLAKKSSNPGGQLRAIIGRALGIEIDAYVLIGFKGVRKLIDRIGGVTVTVAKTFYDPTYWVTPRHRGWGLKKGVHHLGGTSALIFARTRHGDSDYARARRQQQLVMAAEKKVEARGLLNLANLVAASQGLVRTDLPMAYAPLIFEMVSRADLGKAKRTVFGPRTYASSVGGFSNVLKLSVCKAWVKANFPPRHPGSAWLPPVVPPPPPPSPTPTPPPTRPLDFPSGATGQPISRPGPP